MPSLRVERVPVRTLGLGLLGFDHLQIVYDPSGVSFGVVTSRQDRWFVVEGLREVDAGGVRLGVEGWHGATTLAEANGGATGDDLENRIGTPETRGSREIAHGAEATALWAGLVAAAADFDRQHFPYFGYAPEQSSLPTVNSTSLVGSLLQHVGLDPNAAMPFGLRLSPGLTTLLGTSGDDTLTTGVHGVTTILAGGGTDDMSGTDDPTTIDKLYGGPGNDTFRWSLGSNILHGGQPGIDYAADGIDTVSYAGAGHIEILGSDAPRAHVAPDFTVTFPGGTDELFSIEELVWDAANDHVVVGPGVGLLRTSLTLKLGAGDDVVEAGRSQCALTIDAGPGNDTIESGSGATSISGGPGADRYIIGASPAHLTIRDSSPEDRVRITWPITSVHANVSSGAHAVHDLVLDVVGPAGRSAHLVIQHFDLGALGICALDEAALIAALAQTAIDVSGFALGDDLASIEIAHHP